MTRHLRLAEVLADVDVFGLSVVRDRTVDARPVTLTDRQIGFLTAAADELRSQGSLVYPVILDGIVRAWHEGGGEAA